MKKAVLEAGGLLLKRTRLVGIRATDPGEQTESQKLVTSLTYHS